MSDQTMNVYEGMFLFPQAAMGNLQAAADHVTELLKRADAEVLSLAKWDERRLAYEIKGNKRGVYFLSYFRANGDRLQGLERDCNLSEQLLRAMVLRADHMPQDVIEAAEGRDKLADEIKLRAESPAETTARAEVKLASEVAAEAAEAAKPAETAVATEEPPAEKPQEKAPDAETPA